MVKHDVSKSRPIHAVQMSIYRVYMEASIPGISVNPALFTAINNDSEEVRFELVPFDGGPAQRMGLVQLPIDDPLSIVTIPVVWRAGTRLTVPGRSLLDAVIQLGRSP